MKSVVGIISQALSRLRLVENDVDGVETDFVDVAALHAHLDEAALMRDLAIRTSLEA